MLHLKPNPPKTVFFLATSIFMLLHPDGSEILWGSGTRVEPTVTASFHDRCCVQWERAKFGSKLDLPMDIPFGVRMQ